MPDITQPIEQPQDGSQTQVSTAEKSLTFNKTDKNDATLTDTPPAGADTQPKDPSAELNKDNPEGVPSGYDFEMPEGFALNTEMKEELTPLLSKLNVSKEDAQALINLHIKSVQAQQKQIQESWASQEKGWVDTISKDTELGNKENQAIALNAVKEFATPELRSLLEQTRLGSHPEFVRLFMKIGKSISEDSAALGNAGNVQKMPRDESGTPKLVFKSMEK